MTAKATIARDPGPPGQRLEHPRYTWTLELPGKPLVEGEARTPEAALANVRMLDQSARGSGTGL